MTLAVGFCGHVAVTVAVDFRVVDRREIRVRDGQPYHHARVRPLAEARTIIDQANADARERMLDGIGRLRSDLGPRDLAAVGLVLGSFRLPSSLEALLASHPACHAAEGEMSREAVLAVAEELGLPVIGVRDRDLEIDADVESAGKALGPPWRKEHKRAAAVARLALASQRRP